jgi:hypothetical protein
MFELSDNGYFSKCLYLGSKPDMLNTFSYLMIRKESIYGVKACEFMVYLSLNLLI